MSVLDLNLGQVPDQNVAEAGEYQFTIGKTEVKTKAETGNTFISMWISLPEVPTSPDFTHILMLPKDDDDEKQRISKGNRLKRFLEAVGIDPATFQDSDELVGATGRAVIKVVPSDQYGDQNSIQKVLPAMQ